MSDRTSRPAAGAERAAKRRPSSRRPSASRPAPDPGRGPMGGGMVGQKAMTFGPSAKRLVAPDAARAGACRSCVVLLAVVSVALMSIGPRILGQATDLVFSGLFSRQPARGRDPGAGGAGPPRAGRGPARRHARLDGPRGPRPGRRLRRGRRRAAARARGVRRRLAAGVAPGLPPQRRRPGHRLRMRRTSRTRSTGCRWATSTGSRAASCSAGSPTTSTTSARPCSRR